MIRMQIGELLKLSHARDYRARRDNPAHADTRETQPSKSCPTVITFESSSFSRGSDFPESLTE